MPSDATQGLNVWERLRRRVSRLNHRLKWARRAGKCNRAVQAARALDDAVPWSDVCAVFAMLRPMQTEHPLIRIGPDYDGGYLVPDDLSNIRATFSPGVSDILGFDQEMSRRCQACYLADASVAPPRDLADNMKFDQKFIGSPDDPRFITLHDWVDQNEPGSDDLLLQMDIEGAEYDVLTTVPEPVLSRFRVVLIEFHDLDKIFDRAVFDRVRAALLRLRETHVLCHVHSNNTAPYFETEGVLVASVVEASYIRRDRVGSQISPALVPHALDCANDPKLPDALVPRFWDCAADPA